MRARRATPEPATTDRTLAATPLFSLCEFECPPDAPAWRRENQIGPWAVLAFARAPVSIEHDGSPAVVADRSCVMIYNPGARYRRRLLDPRGDNCVFIGLPRDAALDAARSRDPRADDHPDRPFARTRSETSADAYTLLVRLLRAHRSGDPEAIEDLGVRLIDAVLGACAPTPADTPVHARTRRAHAELVEATRAEIARSVRENRSLADIARAVHASPFHLARLFRAHTGRSIVEHRAILRAREAAAELLETRDPVAPIARRLGYASQSHMTLAFRRAFGVTPARFRARDRRSARS